MTDTERVVLTLAATPYRYPAVRDRHAREQLGMSPVEFWATVNQLLDRGDVEAEMPREVHRLRRLRERREAVRSAGRLGRVS